VADSQIAEKKLLFMPGTLVPGIEAADPMIAARSAAYIVSLSRRAQAQFHKNDPLQTRRFGMKLWLEKWHRSQQIQPYREGGAI
jgi:catalase